MNPQTPDTTDVKQLQIIDLLAYQLYVNGPDETPRLPLQAWQETPVLRQDYRATARALIDELEEDGVSLRVTKTKKFETAVETLRTIPARTAYDDQEIGIDMTPAE